MRKEKLDKSNEEALLESRGLKEEIDRILEMDDELIQEKMRKEPELMSDILKAGFQALSNILELMNGAD